MTDQAKREDEVTPAGAVEVDETELDQAAGGISGYSQPAETVATEVYKLPTDKADIKVFTPDASIPLVEKPPEKM